MAITDITPSTRARNFVAARSKAMRSKVEPSSALGQLYQIEDWANRQLDALNEKVAALSETHKPEGIREAIREDQERIEREAKEKFEKLIEPRVKSAQATLAKLPELPDADPHGMTMLVQHYAGLPPEDRRAAYRDALTGTDPELRRALASAPLRMTGLDEGQRRELVMKFADERLLAEHEAARQVVEYAEHAAASLDIMQRGVRSAGL